VARVVFDRVCKRYGRGAPPTVRDLSLTVEDRELLVVVGPSGCGKSTALRMIAGLEAISSGSLFIDHERVNDVPPKDRDVAMVFQSYALYPHMTCFENMAFALTLRKTPRAEIRRRVLDAARILAIEPLLERRPKELSGGQRQRVAIGRAIVREPRVFLMDEPLSNLDAKLRTSMRAELKRLHRELGATIVYVTHDQTEALALGDRIAVMRAGELLQLDAPTEIYRRPKNVFVATFIGLPPMNLLPGVLRDGAVEVAGARFEAPRGAATPRDVLVGVRPEHLEAGGAPSAGLFLSGAVEALDWMGAESWAHVSTDGGGVVVCRAPASNGLAVGARVRVTASLRDVHVFDASTEERIA
jgi:multiple sugar transport system ATP-binding protein